jgi:hypothetical protein
MRKLLSFGFLLSRAAAPCLAQNAPRWDVAAGSTYAFAEDGYGNAYNFNGGSASAAYNFNNWIGAAAEATVIYAYVGGFGNTVQSYTAGPRFSYRKHERYTPFAETLVGFGRNTVNPGCSECIFSYHAVSLNVDAGTDIALGSTGKFAFRPELGYALFANNSGASSLFRASFSLVYHIGHIEAPSHHK